MRFSDKHFNAHSNVHSIIQSFRLRRAKSWTEWEKTNEKKIEELFIIECYGVAEIIQTHAWWSNYLLIERKPKKCFVIDTLSTSNVRSFVGWFSRQPSRDRVFSIFFNSNDHLPLIFYFVLNWCCCCCYCSCSYIFFFPFSSSSLLVCSGLLLMRFILLLSPWMSKPNQTKHTTPFPVIDLYIKMIQSITNERLRKKLALS